jgi:fatty-acyl-CoA synthase
LPQTEVKIVNPDTGAIVPRGATGEICARGYSIMKDYFDDPAATASAIDSEGWLHTGDLGSLDKHGYCRVQGRLKDMIIRGGENIYPREVEDVLYAHPAILEASVVGIPDPVWGEVPIAFVQLKPGHQSSAQELMDFCREKLAFAAPTLRSSHRGASNGSARSILMAGAFTCTSMPTRPWPSQRMATTTQAASGGWSTP